MIIDCETGKIISRCHITGLSKISFNSPSNNHHMKNQSFYNESLGQVSSYAGTGYGHVGDEILRLYTAKAQLKKTQLKYLSSESKQFGSFKNLMIY